ncbi:spermatogenesis-associated protein 5-like protein 1 [Alosa sapidissima]|uniref:spermatogenesis-associated protein 5-like protein 1 n=1 Tax=Alosa sapidissima TaxID=34773 RepID=UPI001C09E3A0|nr:spermatogenesis-associated protein 5-like protein 1 [Alosa sapidissima]
MMATKDLELQLIPCDTLDKNTQRCRIGPGLMSSLRLNIGSPVLISTPGGACLCTAWPRNDLAEGYFQFDTKCVTPNFRPIHNPYHLNCEDIRPLNGQKLKRIKVNVVVKSSEFKKRIPPHLINDIVKEILCGVYVHEKHIIAVNSFETEMICIHIENVNSGSTKVGLVTERTCLELAAVITHAEHSRRIAQESSRISIGGMEDVYGSLKELIHLPLFYPNTLRKLGVSCPRGVLLVGPPGVGKTMLVRSVVKEVGASLITINGPVILGSRPGESEENLRAMFQQAREAAEDGPCVLFIDEIDSLCPKRAGSSSAPENRVVAQLLTLMDGMVSRDHFVTIGATNQPDTLDPALRRPGRFDREVIIGVPTLTQRKSILEYLSEKMPLSCSVDLIALAEVTTGYVGADLSALCREAALQAILRSPEDTDVKAIEMQHFHEALKTVQPSCLRSSIGLTDYKPITWEQIGGLDDVKLKLKQSIEWPMKYPESFIRLGLSRPKGILLYGPPGCAKTTLVKAAASSSHCAFLSVSGADLFSPFVGDSEKALAQLFHQARACAPSIVFLDEVDTLLGSRGDTRVPHSVQAQVLSVLLTELDGIGLKTMERRGTQRMLCVSEERPESQQEHQMEYHEVCNKDVMIVAATNRPDALDSALMRPGRLDRIIYVPPPDYEARLAILRICTEKMPLDSDVSLEELASQTSLFSGADLENLCKEAALLTLHEKTMEASRIQQKYFIKALQNSKPSLSALQMESYHHLFT